MRIEAAVMLVEAAFTLVKTAFTVVEAPCFPVEAPCLPVEAMDHLEHSTKHCIRSITYTYILTPHWIALNDL